MSNKIRILLFAVCFFTYLGVVSPQSLQAQIPGDAKSLSPELIGNLTKGLSISPQQAAGGAGALFGLAKTRLKPAEFTKIADVVPGMDGLLGAAPKQTDGIGAMAASMPGKAGGLSSVAGSFKSLGLSPSMATKFVPIMTKFAQAKGGSSVGSLLSGALK